jgi:hypothetical protein
MCTANSVCRPSEDIVAREIEGELIIVPLVAGIGDADDELYTMNETGREIWRRLDGKKTLGAVTADLAEVFEGTHEQIERDVLGIVTELLKRRMLVEVSRGGNREPAGATS